MKKSKSKIFYYLGPKGSYTEQAAKQFLTPKSHDDKLQLVALATSPKLPVLRRSDGNQSKMVEVFSVYQILDKITQESSVRQLLQNGRNVETDLQPVSTTTSPNREKDFYGVVPVENSSEGALKIVLDTVIEKKLKIIGEVYLPISHCLLSKKRGGLGDVSEPTQMVLKKIKTIYSHPQALAQSSDWIRENIPHAKIKETESTSRAAQIVLKEKQSAAISSEYCAKSYGLHILARQLEENPNNYTRFWVLGNKIIRRKTNDKISIFICLNDRVAALRDLLNIFSKYNLNLSKIESLALKGQAWRYGFLIDFFGNAQEKNIKLALKEIRQEVASLEILGQYQNCQYPDKTVEYFVKYLQELFKQNKKIIEGKNIKTKSTDVLDKLLETRLLLIPSVALYKYLNKIPKNKIYQPKREKEVIKKRLLQIKKKNIGPSDLLIKLVEQNFRLSKEIQKTIYEMLVEKTIDASQIKNIKLNKLRDLLDQIDENFDEALASLPKETQKKRLGELVALK